MAFPSNWPSSVLFWGAAALLHPGGHHRPWPINSEIAENMVTSKPLPVRSSPGGTPAVVSTMAHPRTPFPKGPPPNEGKA